MAEPLLAYFPIVAAALMVLLACWLLSLKFNSTVNRAFALFLFLRAGVSVANTLSGRDIQNRGLWIALGPYFGLLLVPTLAYFAVSYILPRSRTRLLRIILVVAAAVVELAYLSDHCLVVCEVAGKGLVAGPLSLLTYAVPLAYGGIALLLAPREIADARVRPGEVGAAIVSFALGLNALLDGTAALATLGRAALLADPSPLLLGWTLLGVGIYGVAIVPAALAIGQLRRKGYIRVPGIVATAVTLVAGLFLGTTTPGGPLGETVLLVGVILRIALPAMVAYALVRHQFLDVHARVRWTISSGTVAGSFLLVFLIVANVGQNYFSDRLGWAIGGFAAALLFFALNPLQRIAERLAHAAFPTTPAAETLAEDRRRLIYREQAILLWRDGFLTAKERILLDQLRERLELSAEDASKIESGLLAATPDRETERKA